MLAKAQLTHFEQNKLVLTLGNEGSIVNSQRYWLENQLSELWQTSLRLELKINHSKPESNSSTIHSPKATKEEIMKQILAKSEHLRKLVDEFDLEIM